MADPGRKEQREYNAMHLNVVVQLILLVACTSSVSGDAPEPGIDDPRCEPERSGTSACVWTDDCQREGCTTRCITNWEVTESWSVLLDRSFGDGFYTACPELAFYINNVLKDVRGPGWQLSSQIDNRPSSSVGPSSDSDDIPSNIPSNPCPNPEDITDVGKHLMDGSSAFKRVFESVAAGDPLPAHLADFEYVLGEPNKRQWLATILADPDRVAEYMATNCTEKVISSPRAWQYQHFIPPEEAATLTGDPTMLQCVDNFGAWEQFDRNLVDVYITCSPPFGLEPDCFTDLGHYMITSPQCASAYARMWNVADPAPLLNVASHVNAIHDACARVTTEEACLSTNTRAVDMINDLHDSIPAPHALVFAGDALPPAPVVCFGDECALGPATEDRIPPAGAPPQPPALLAELAPEPAATGGSRELNDSFAPQATDAIEETLVPNPPAQVEPAASMSPRYWTAIPIATLVGLLCFC